MVMRLMLVVATLSAFALTGAEAQRMYRWVDKNGTVHYTEQAPPADAKSVERRAISAGAAGSPVLPYATRTAASNFPVTLFTAADCGAPCSEGRESLEKRGIPFDETVVGDEKSVEALKRIAGKTQVPVLRIGKQIMLGFDPVRWKSALDDAGYPSSGPPTTARVEAAGPKKLPPVKLYTRADCGNLCEDARKLLAARKIGFEEVDVKTKEAADELTKLAGAPIVPVLVVGDRVQRGFDANFYKSFLDGIGFPPAPPAEPAPAAGANN